MKYTKKKKELSKSAQLKYAWLADTLWEGKKNMNMLLSWNLLPLHRRTYLDRLGSMSRSRINMLLMIASASYLHIFAYNYYKRFNCIGYKKL